ncbi:Phage shock protein PspC (stress-responsive transcriptional regulator) [Evansella caseinilytica]|uniref:Phage shock protein PspC (Stress-responsive transcriptional regulator) n=1 Tax=Evansella caseinilytica TaxID=1503961 RepID=A0A1H3S8Z1_9BACI|nr:PspC domain-containing protein [Evansella caseinilytica]SDZ34364.1 Phage shock protein PspC (stress-responsive transcriptional regulator) [Evansella caseinilytica]
MNRLYRSVNDRKVAGVCGGLGAYFNIDPTVVRLLTVVLLFISMGTAVVAYIVATVIIPNETDVY